MVAGAAFPAPEPPALDLGDDMKIRAITLLLAVAALAAPAHAQQAPAGVALQPPVERPVLGTLVGEPGVPPQLMTAGFLPGHPDVRWQRATPLLYPRQSTEPAADPRPREPP